MIVIIKFKDYHHIDLDESEDVKLMLAGTISVNLTLLLKSLKMDFLAILFPKLGIKGD